MSGDFDPYLKWLAIPPADQPPNHYRLLGVPEFIDDPDVIEHAADQRMTHLRSFQNGPRSALSQKILNELAAARNCLLTAEKKAAYDAQLRASREPEPEVAPEPEPQKSSLVVGPSEFEPSTPVAVVKPPDDDDGYNLVPLETSQTLRPFVPSRVIRRRPAPNVLPVVLMIVAGIVGVCAILLVAWYVWENPTLIAELGSSSDSQSASPSRGAEINSKQTADPPSRKPRRNAETMPDPKGTSPRDEPEATTANKAATNEIMTNALGMQFRLIPAGEFLMGSTDDDAQALDAEKPQHSIRITKPFYMAEYKVTQSEYEFVMGTNPSQFSAKGEQSDKVRGQDTKQHPVENVSWYDAIHFCNQLSLRDKRPSYYRRQGEEIRILGGNGYRLPTEAEWEYACRAGTTTKFYFGDDPAEIEQHCWFNHNSGKTTHPVGQKKPNPWGLYDMYGNVWEWCWDVHDPNYYQNSPPNDPIGSTINRGRVVRGGSWTLGYFRSASRNFGVGPNRQVADGGFRVVAFR